MKRPEIRLTIRPSAFAAFALLWLTVFLAADCLLIFTLGSLLPLGFTDGSTILRWRQRSRAGSNKA